MPCCEPRLPAITLPTVPGRSAFNSRHRVTPSRREERKAASLSWGTEAPVSTEIHSAASCRRLAALTTRESLGLMLVRTGLAGRLPALPGMSKGEGGDDACGEKANSAVGEAGSAASACTRGCEGRGRHQSTPRRELRAQQVP